MVTLEAQDYVETRDEEEVWLYFQRSKLYCWRDRDAKERDGEGRQVALPQTERAVRLRLRQMNTMKIVGDFMVGVDDASSYQLRSHAGSEKCCKWFA